MALVQQLLLLLSCGLAFFGVSMCGGVNTIVDIKCVFLRVSKNSVHTYIHTKVHIHKHIYLHICIYTYIYIQYTYTYTHTYTHTHMHIYIYTYNTNICALAIFKPHEDTQTDGILWVGAGGAGE